MTPVVKVRVISSYRRKRTLQNLGYKSIANNEDKKLEIFAEHLSK